MVRILVVDDNPSVRRYLRAILEQHGSWRVCGEAKTGSEALDKVIEELKRKDKAHGRKKSTG